MSEIKPCPFCGSDKVTVIEGSTSRWCVAQCVECGAQAGEVRKECQVRSVQTGDMRKAIEEWNARAAPAAVPEGAVAATEDAPAYVTLSEYSAECALNTLAQLSEENAHAAARVGPVIADLRIAMCNPWKPCPAPQVLLNARHKEPAMRRYTECGGNDEPDPLERLRFFLSIALTNSQDWIDVEPFLDALRPAPQVPDVCRQALEDACVVNWVNADLSTVEGAKKAICEIAAFDVKIATDPATNGGYVLVPKEPTGAMVTAGADVVSDDYDDGRDQRHREIARFAYRAMLSAAQAKEEE